ncbi:aspartyl/asparaginyl beta-hydroxylase domain-containing protein [Simiduia sp. 21SJ11W-1]|uniref:aspartyl/asparaginyl beta-hydroxylase domain-containing protein n=1 Tax=Simiduia sp. 21SJ11W-1 TaxID=2909669 RepID=UPI00209CF399|nr:aspartyl/asparaginyl beta-hydroxylase domain-containing protein [Simiduia sp. 21SJ11W-1]UTA48789.1 aspartyl/asparaginyl beta-hydroxylase domain-containing protein [Simiduia sp. 21SJ11W-1]
MSTDRMLNALRQGDVKGAASIADEVGEISSVDGELNRAMIYRAAGEMLKALRSLDNALALNPYSFTALLSKGYVLECLGKNKDSAEVYTNALMVAPPIDTLPKGMQEAIKSAEQLVARVKQEKYEYIKSQLDDDLGSLSGLERKRMRECMELYTGRKKSYRSEPVDLLVPGLPAIQFFERKYFPWLEGLESCTDVFLNELQSLVVGGKAGFNPYINYAKGTPVNQWKELDGSRKWSTYYLWRDGDVQERASNECPKSTQILSDIPMAHQLGLAPNAVFSALAPETKIPPHNGSTNARLLVHLPLIVPESCGFRVGNEVRKWEVGSAWVFDDTIEHEAWNDSSLDRYILIFDVWNPLLSVEEVEFVSKLMKSSDSWRVL